MSGTLTCSTITYQTWWAGLGTMGIHLAVTVGANGPPIDLTTVVAQRISVWSVSTTSPLFVPVGTFAAIVEGVPTPTSRQFYYLPALNSLPVGSYVCAGGVTLDNAAWYPTDLAALTVGGPAVLP